MDPSLFFLACARWRARNVEDYRIITAPAVVGQKLDSWGVTAYYRQLARFTEARVVPGTAEERVQYSALLPIYDVLDANSAAISPFYSMFSARVRRFCRIFFVPSLSPHTWRNEAYISRNIARNDRAHVVSRFTMIARSAGRSRHHALSRRGGFALLCVRLSLRPCCASPRFTPSRCFSLV